MEYSLYFLTAFLLIVITYVLFSYRKRYTNLPPGPSPFPFFGNIPQLIGKDFQEQLRKYRRQYGNIFTIHIFNKVFVVVNGSEDLKAVFIKNGNVFSDRPKPTELGALQSYRPIGILFSNGKLWRHNRQFAIHKLREFGMGKTVIHDTISDECSHYTEALQPLHGKTFSIADYVKVGVSNVLCSMLFAKRFDYGDERILDVIHKMDVNAQTALHLKVDWLKYIPGDPFKVQMSHDYSREFMNFFNSEVREHCDGLDTHHARDVVDAYIKEMKTSNGKSSSSLMNEADIERICHDIFIAGMKATTSAILFGFIYLIHHPEIQEKIYDELRDGNPGNSPVDFNDRKKCPFMVATIYEILRLSNVAPLGYPHAASDDVTYNGYTIPKSVMVLPNIASILHDEEIWDKPFQFNPSRFLKGKELQKIDTTCPFSVGPRSCPGEELALPILYYFLMSTIWNFKLSPAEGEGPPRTDSCSATIPEPYPYKLKLVKRVV